MRLQAQPSVETLMSKGDSCRDKALFNQALSFYQQAYAHPSVAKHPELHMQLLERIMRSHYMMNHWKEMPEASYQLYHLAKRHKNPSFLSKALFMRGIRCYMEGDKELGYSTCKEAMELMKKVDDPLKDHDLSISCALLTNMYISDKRFDEATRMLNEQERYVHLERDKKAEERGMLRVYNNRMYLLASLGRNAEADSLYARYGNISVIDPISAPALLNYLRLRGKTDESLRLIELGIQHLYEDGDTVGRNIRRLLNDKADIYFHLGEYQKAAECYADMGRIADSISAQTLRKVASEVYKVIDNEHDAARHRQLLIITVAGILLLLAVVVLVGRQGFVERRKNRSMMNTIQQLMHYRDLVIQNGDTVEMGENSTGESLEDEQRRFKEVDKRIMKELLFAKPDFGRDDLMRLLGVDKNTLPSLIQRYTGTNVPGYVNNKRMEYAIQLIKQHPEYTLGAISEACGIKSPATFIRNFKSAYGMTPSEFRKQLDEIEFTPPILTFYNTKTL
jgi:AraC-like DNA-binding protein/tetratricopeptide (TPR) repeat protein